MSTDNCHLAQANLKYPKILDLIIECQESSFLANKASKLIQQNGDVNSNNCMVNAKCITNICSICRLLNLDHENPMSGSFPDASGGCQRFQCGNSYQSVAKAGNRGGSALHMSSQGVYGDIPNSDLPPVICYIAVERSTIFNGKTHYFDWAMASIGMLNYQRVQLTML